MTLLDRSRPGALVVADARDLLARVPDASVDLVVIDPPFGTFAEGEAVVALRSLLEDVVAESHRVLRERGNLAYTIPPAGTATPEAFDARLVIRQVFQQDPLEITRPLPRANVSSRPRSDREVTLWVPVTDASVYNESAQNLDRAEFHKRFPKEDEQGRYSVMDLTSPGDRPALRFEIGGVAPPPGRSWRLREERVRELESEGRIEFGGRLPRLKVYVGDRPLPSVGLDWNDLSSRIGKSERVQAPQVPDASAIQKPLDFARRLIVTGTDSDAVVLDPFCGTGTTLVAAAELGRRWIGGDLSESLVEISGARLSALTTEDVLTDLGQFEPVRSPSPRRPVVASVSGIVEIQEENEALRSEVARYVSLFQDVRELLGVEGDDEDAAVAVLDKLAQVMADRLATPEKMAEYRDRVGVWLDDWDRLGDKSKVFLPQAEMLVDFCALVGDADYGIAVVQYCKTLEHEMLSKLFGAYKVHFDADVTDPKDFVDPDIESEDKTALFARALLREDPKFTLGAMSFVLTLAKLPGGKTLKRSALLRHFRDFAARYFAERVREADFVAEVDRITKEYRNEAAHGGLVGRETALACQAAVRAVLIDFVRSYRPA